LKTSLRVAIGLLVVLIAALLAASVSAKPGTLQESCEACHPQEFDEWLGSAHAVAGSSETFMALMNQGAATPSEWQPDDCLRCHDAQRYEDGVSVADVSCEICHTLEPGYNVGNGDFTLAQDGVMRGPTGAPAAHPTVASDFLTSSQFCATCHEQYNPTTGVPLQTTYTEWLNGPAAAQGVGCEDCHMSHGFRAGGDTSGLANAISMEVEPQEPVQAGGSTVVRVMLENVGAGHSLPTGKNESHEMWLEFTAQASDGRILHQERLDYGVVYDNADGDHSQPVTLWDASAIFADRRLVPGMPVAEEFPFVVPMDVQGAIEVSATLMYRSQPAWLTDQLSLPEAEAISLQTASAQIEVLAAPATPTYVPPTPIATLAPESTPEPGTTAEAGPTAKAGPTAAAEVAATQVKAESTDWIPSFIVAVGIVLLLVIGWAVYRRAV
jgi:hypothetical protein